MTYVQNVLASSRKLEPALGFEQRNYSPIDQNLMTRGHPNLPAVEGYQPTYDQLDVSIDPDGSIYWAFMRPYGRPCFTPELLSEIQLVQSAIRGEYARRQQMQTALIKYVVLGSRSPGASYRAVERDGASSLAGRGTGRTALSPAPSGRGTDGCGPQAVALLQTNGAAARRRT